jgi:hypothetical protein
VPLDVVGTRRRREETSFQRRLKVNTSTTRKGTHGEGRHSKTRATPHNPPILEQPIVERPELSRRLLRNTTGSLQDDAS